MTSDNQSDKTTTEGGDTTASLDDVLTALKAQTEAITALVAASAQQPPAASAATTSAESKNRGRRFFCEHAPVPEDYDGPFALWKSGKGDFEPSYVIPTELFDEPFGTHIDADGDKWYIIPLLEQKRKLASLFAVRKEETSDPSDRQWGFNEGMECCYIETSRCEPVRTKKRSVCASVAERLDELNAEYEASQDLPSEADDEDDDTSSDTPAPAEAKADDWSDDDMTDPALELSRKLGITVDKAREALKLLKNNG